MKLIGYCRVSTTMQEEEGISLDAQCEHIKKWCDISKTPHGTDYNLIDIVKEQGSAKSLKRPKLQAIREQCNEGVANGIIVVKLDRLTRSLRDITYLIENDFKKYDLISIGERLDTESAVGRLMLNMIVMVSQWEREAIGERTKTTLRYKKSKAEKTGGQVPYGYQEKIEESNGKSVKVLTINKSEFQMISLILDMWTSQSYSLNKISKVLLEKSYVNRNGNKFHPQQIKRIIEYHNNSQLTLNSSCGGKSWGKKT